MYKRSKENILTKTLLQPSLLFYAIARIKFEPIAITESPTSAFEEFPDTKGLKKDSGYR